MRGDALWSTALCRLSRRVWRNPVSLRSGLPKSQRSEDGATWGHRTSEGNMLHVSRLQSRTSTGVWIPTMQLRSPGTYCFDVHRAASVYTPRTLVTINPPSVEKVAQIREAGGSDRALSWVLSGLKAATFQETSTTVASFRASLRKQGDIGFLSRHNG
jgi:hypothetical protein